MVRRQCVIRQFEVWSAEAGYSLERARVKVGLAKPVGLVKPVGLEKLVGLEKPVGLAKSMFPIRIQILSKYILPVAFCGRFFFFGDSLLRLTNTSYILPLPFLINL